MVTLAPAKVPVAGFLVLGLLFLGVSSLVAFPLSVWLAVRIASRTQPYLWLKSGSSGWNDAGRHLATPELDHAMIMMSEYGYGYPFWATIIVVLLALVVCRHWLEAAGFLLCLAGEAILNLGLKPLFERSRQELFQVVTAAGYSFPSGHAMLSICLYGMVAFLITRHIRSWHWRLAVIIFGLVLVATIGVSRVYLGVHYPTDVVAGFFAGGAWLALFISLLMWWEHRRLQKKKL